MAESFFATLECELLDRRRFASQAEARMASFSYIEGWYNPARLHSGLGYRSPMTYEAERKAALTEPKPASLQTVHENGATSALAETVIGLFKTEVIHQRGPWRSFEAVEFATLERVDWFNNRRLAQRTMSCGRSDPGS